MLTIFAHAMFRRPNNFTEFQRFISLQYYEYYSYSNISYLSYEIKDANQNVGAILA